MIALLLTAALAHGPPPQGTGVLLVDEQGPVHVALTEGMAVRDGEAWRFVCPSLWGSSPDFAVGVGFDDKSWLFGSDGRYPVTPEGVVEEGDIEALRATALLDWAVGERPLALRRDLDEREILDIVTGEVLWSGTGAWNTFVAFEDGSFWLAGVTDDEWLQFMEVSPEGLPGEIVDIEPATYTPRFVYDEGQVYLQRRRAGAHSLVTVSEEWTLTEIASTPLFIAGPSDGWLLLDQTLTRVDDAEVQIEGVTCLNRANGHTHACRFPNIFAVDDVGLSEEPVFELDIEPPDLDLVEEGLRDDCEADWVRMAVDLGIEDPYEDLEDPQDDTTAEELPAGCGCATGSSGGLWAWIAGMAWLGIRRRTRS